MKMSGNFSKTRMALAVAAAVGAGTAMTPGSAEAATGHYVAGDFHNHTTCSDGAVSMQKMIGKSTDKADGSFGLDWFVQAGHGGSGNRNCTLVEDESLATPAYPYIAGQGPTTTWLNSSPAVQPKGLVSGSGTSRNMWRWQAIQEFQYPVDEYLGTLKKVPVFTGVESNGPGHEHISMAVITGQVPATLDKPKATLPQGPIVAPNTSRYTAVGNADALAQWEYCFDRSDTDTSRGNAVVGSSVGNNWDCSVPGLANSADVSWNATALKLMPASGTGSGDRGHAKSLASLEWMEAFHPEQSYYVPAHLERPGPFNPNGNNGYNIEHLRDFNNAAPQVAFGFETQPGHHASDNRGEYSVGRNNFGSGVGQVDSVGGTTYGGTGVYGAVVGGVWDALLGEGRNWWFFGSSDWHNRGQFGPDDRRSTQDFYPGEYQRNHTLVRDRKNRQQPQDIVDGLRTGNTFVTEGQLIDRLSFVACVAKPAEGGKTEARVNEISLEAAANNEALGVKGCATMGEKLVVPAGADVIVSIVLRDPAGTNFSPYTFPNPSLAQVNITQPLNAPVLDHVDLIRGLVTGYKSPNSGEYYGEWPRNTAWLKEDGTTADLSVVPAGAKNTSAAVIKTFGNGGASAWKPVISPVDGSTFLQMSYRIPAVNASQYVRLRGTNLPASVPYETDANGNPLADVYTNAGNAARLTIPCNTAHSAESQFDGCPDHLPTASAGPISGKKAVAYDVAAWADLWFYSNPIYLETVGGTAVAGVQ